MQDIQKQMAKMLKANTPSIVVRCISGSHCGIAEGEVGIVSEVSYANNRAFLRRIECPEWDPKGFDGTQPLKKKETKQPLADEAA